MNQELLYKYFKGITSVEEEKNDTRLDRRLG